MKTLIIASIITLALAYSTTTDTDYPQIVPFSVYSANGAEVFRFNPHHDPDLPVTGLYHNTHPYELIFELEHPSGWAVYSGSFFFSPTMRHFAVVFPYPTDYAIEFFAHGERVSGYGVHELVQDHEFLHEAYISGIGAYYIWWNTLEHDTFDARLLISTFDGVEFIFEILSGRLVYMSGSRSMLLFFLFGGVMLFFFVGTKQIAKRKVASHQNRGYYG